MACEGCSYSFLEFIKEFTIEEEVSFEYLKRHGVLPTKIKCPTCGGDCKLKKSHKTFYCSKRWKDKRRRSITCKFSVTQKKGTFLNQSHIRPNALLAFIALFLSKSKTQREAQDWLGFSSETCVKWAGYCYEVFEYWFWNQCTVGGPDAVVEIGEQRLGNAKYGRGRDVEGKWLFGAYERGSKKLLLFPVGKRDIQALTPIIKRHILPGTTIYSTERRAYSRLEALSLGYTHRTHRAAVNHSAGVSEDGVHTQNVDLCCRDAKSWVFRSGNKVSVYPKYLARYLFSRAYSKTERIHHFLKNAGQLFLHPYSEEGLSEIQQCKSDAVE